MFEGAIRETLAKYGQRLRNVRAELVSISSDLQPLAEKRALQDEPVHEQTALLAKSLQGVCGILVRVLDSLGAKL